MLHSVFVHSFYELTHGNNININIEYAIWFLKINTTAAVKAAEFEQHDADR